MYSTEIDSPDRAAQARTVLRKQAVENLINQSLLLEEAGRQETQSEQKLKEDLMIEVLLDEQLKDVKKVSDEEVSAFYRDHPESSGRPSRSVPAIS